MDFIDIKKIIQKTLLLLCLYTINVYANISNDLNDYYYSLGYASNSTSPAAFQGQQAGNYTGGSFSMRSRVRDVQIVQISVPSYSSGCAGLDIFGGSISLLSRQEVKNTLKSVLNNSVNYATTLALETISPMILKNALYWKDYIDRMNQASINSCELAESMVGGVWPKTRAAQQRICQDIGTSSPSIYSSWAEARQGCGNDKEMQRINQIAKNNPNYRDMVIADGNIVWKAIQKRSFLRDDVELAELFMSLSGTLVLTRDQNGNVQKYLYPALANKDDLIDALLNGKTTTIYHCEETVDCLHPTKEHEIIISKEHAFKYKVASLLNNIATKVKSDAALSEDEKGLIEATSLPILQMITVTSAYLKEGSTPNVDMYAVVIAADILYQYLQEALTIVKTSVAALPLPDGFTDPIEKEIESSMRTLSSKRTKLNNQIEVTMQLVTQTQAIEKMLVGEFSTELASTISWAKGLK